jgi:starch synthase (maltosyl-transferring)
MLGRTMIQAIRPSTPSGYPAKAVVGQIVTVSADIFRDGHEVLAARVRYRPAGAKAWAGASMREDVNDRWEGMIVPETVGAHEFVVEAWVDEFATWRHDIELKAAADLTDPLATELEEGARILERLARRVDKADRPRVRAAIDALRDGACTRDNRLTAGLDQAVAVLVAGLRGAEPITRSGRLRLWVDRPLARAGGWYEFFPRSEGGFEGAAKRLRAIAEMGFDIVYLPPIHPIGRSQRKGANNTLSARPGDPGSPWAIGGDAGGHTAVHPDLGSLADFDAFVAEAAAQGLEVALDYALQCSPDHPWVHEHPEWFHHRPDGTIKYAENPPKKYQDIYPLNFWPPSDADRKALWKACKDIFDYWLARGVRLFRVDNPHTKPLAFWEWVLDDVRREHADVIFLAEAFTRPKMMAKLAEIGFTQSYTYFTWRTERWELEQYLTELAGSVGDYMRPNFWPNTPDILSGPLRNGSRAAFMLRYVLAVTMSPAWGLYSGYELGENEPAADANEEYLHSEKYELKARDWDDPASIAPFITRVNEIRRRHPAFDELSTIRFHDTGNDALIAYSKRVPDGTDPVLVVVNLDPLHAQAASLSLDMAALGLDWYDRLTVRDELSGDSYDWNQHPYVRLDPDGGQVAHIFAVSR